MTDPKRIVDHVVTSTRQRVGQEGLDLTGLQPLPVAHTRCELTDDSIETKLLYY
jgi:hypothetical protein